MKARRPGARRAPALAAITVAAVLFAAPAWATITVAIPEPESIGLFLAGVVATVVGLRFWRRK